MTLGVVALEACDLKSHEITEKASNSVFPYFLPGMSSMPSKRDSHKYSKYQPCHSVCLQFFEPPSFISRIDSLPSHIFGMFRQATRNESTVSTIFWFSIVDYITVANKSETDFSSVLKTQYWSDSRRYLRFTTSRMNFKVQCLSTKEVVFFPLICYTFNNLIYANTTKGYYLCLKNVR